MAALSDYKPIEVLMIEDNPADIRLTQEALKNSKIINTLHIEEDGDAALQFLQERAENPELPMVDLILLDLNLPGISGHEVLNEIKGHKSLKHIPVVVLTTSEVEKDIVKSYDLHANCFITKPIGMEQFIDVVRSIESFWFTITTLPKL